MKKLLIITYYWPPCGGPSVQRWIQLSHNIRNFGWQPVILTTQNGDYPLIDNSLEKNISPSIKVIRTKTLRFGEIFKILTGKKKLPYGSLDTKKNDSIIKKFLFYIRRNFIAPDIRIIWNKQALKVAKSLLRKTDFDAIITTGPPHSTHLIGLKLQSQFKVKWYADFRDPWTNIVYNANEERFFLTRMIDKYLEQKVVSRADSIITVSKFIAQDLPKGEKIVLSNGFNHKDFENIEYTKNHKFRIKYIGKLTQGREIFSILNTINKISKDIEDENIEFSFIGTYNDEPTEFRDKFKYIDFRFVPYLTHNDAIGEMVQAEILLLLINNYSGNKGMLTLKMFEYIGSRTFILGIGPTNGNAAEIINKLNAGKMIDYNQENLLKKQIIEKHKQWEKKLVVRNNSNINEFSTFEIAKKLSDFLDNDKLG